MKNIVSIILLFLTIQSCTTLNDEFVLNVEFKGEYPEYIYLNYESSKDSALIKNGKCVFKGKVKHPASAYFSALKITSTDKIFYLENKSTINIEVLSELKSIRENEIYLFNINNISGTEISLIQNDFDDFKEKNYKNKKWSNSLYQKLEKVIKANPSNKYVNDLFLDLSNDSSLDKGKLKELYALLNIENLDDYNRKKIEFNIFVEKRIIIGDTISDFELLNSSNKLINTVNYRNKILLIDFWASWCGPCRKEFPEIINISKKFESDDFKVLGVSFDENKKKWLKAIKDDELTWENIIDTTSLKGNIAKRYGVFKLPFNILVDKKGVIISKNSTPKEIENKLDTLFK